MPSTQIDRVFEWPGGCAGLNRVEQGPAERVFLTARQAGVGEVEARSLVLRDFS